MTKSDLEIIIVSYNSQFWLKKTLLSLREHFLLKTTLLANVTAVDNGSSDDSVKMLKKEFSWVELIELSENEGFAVANNAALKKTTARFVLLLNSDVECTEHSELDQLIAYLEKHPKVGIISPRIEFTTGELDPACHRGEPTLWAAATYFSGLEKLFPQSQLFGQYHQGYKDLSTPHEIDACSGAAMLVRTSALKKVGLLDERFFMYAEDLDWCRRFRDAGYSVFFHPAAVVIHHKYKSGIKNTSQTIARTTRRHFYDTMLQYYDKYYRESYPTIVRQFIKYFIVLKKGAV
jgi:GT2 family glycosyltransferase